MLILLDGPDRVGKDTLARNIISFFSNETFLLLHTVHIKNYEQKDYHRWYKKIFELSKNTDYSIILNRTHLSEFVFGNMYRNYDSKTVFDLEKIIVSDNNVFLFLLTDKIENLLKREDGNSIFFNSDDKKCEIENFCKGFNNSSIKNKYLINIDKKNTDEVFEEVKKNILEKLIV